MKSEQLNERDYDLISAYLDGELKGSDLTVTRKKIASDALWKQTYEDLRQHKALIRALPRHKAPRSYQLKAELVESYKPGWMTRFLSPAFSFASMALMVLLLVSYALEPQLINMLSPQAPQSMMLAPAEAVAADQIGTAAEIDADVPLIHWGQPARQAAAGKGGMGGGGGTAMMAGPIALAEPESLPESSGVEPAEEEFIPLEGYAVAPLPKSIHGPTHIYGIAPPAEQGKITYIEPVAVYQGAMTEARAVYEQELRGYDLKEVRLYLVLLMLGFASAAYYIRNKAR